MKSAKIITWCAWITLSIAFWGIVLLNASSEFYDLGGDSAQYIILSESLSQGLGYRALNYPQEPFFTHYPPVFPLLLSPIIHFWGRNFYLMQLFVALTGYGSLFFIYRLFRMHIKKKDASFLTLVFATNFVFISYSAKYILSDIPYLFVSCAALFYAAEYVKAKQLSKKGIATLIAIVASYFTRYAGVTLFFSILIFLLLYAKQHYKKIYFIGFGFLAPFVSWNIAAKMLNPGYSYPRQFFLIDPYRPFLGTILNHPRAAALRLIEGINYYCSVTGNALFSPLQHSVGLRDFLSLFSFVMVFSGLWLSFRKNKFCVFHYYFLAYFLMISLWPFKEGIRFILPILPFIYYYFFEAARYITGFLSKKAMVLSFYSFFLILNLLGMPLRKDTFNDLPQAFKNFISMHAWVKNTLPQEAILVSRKPTITYFYTHHKAILYPFTIQPEEIWNEIIKNRAHYIITDEFSQETYFYLLPFLYTYNDKISIVHRVGNTILFKVKKEYLL